MQIKHRDKISEYSDPTWQSANKYSRTGESEACCDSTQSKMRRPSVPSKAMIVKPTPSRLQLYHQALDLLLLFRNSEKVALLRLIFIKVNNRNSWTRQIEQITPNTFCVTLDPSQQDQKTPFDGRPVYSNTPNLWKVCRKSSKMVQVHLDFPPFCAPLLPRHLPLLVFVSIAWSLSQWLMMSGLGIVLRILLKQNTALLSTVRPSVRHRRDISHFSHIYWA